MIMQNMSQLISQGVKLKVPLYYQELPTHITPEYCLDSILSEAAWLQHSKCLGSILDSALELRAEIRDQCCLYHVYCP